MTQQLPLFHQPYPKNDFVEFRPEETEQSLVPRFEAWVTQEPHRPALKTKELQFTYETFNRAVNRLAWALLRERGETPEPVALLLEQGAEPVVAIMGVVKAGKFYVPLDPAYPPARIRYVLADSGAQVIVTHSRHLALAQELAGDQRQIINLDDLASDLPEENPRLALSPDHLVYIMYTSGSTGQPKGVIETHRNLLHHLMRLTNALHICKEDRQTLLRSYSFNGSVRDIFGSLLNGACVCPFNVESEGIASLAAWLRAEEITTYRSVISLFRHFATQLVGQETFPHLRLVHVGGEPVTGRDVELFQAHFSEDCLLVNGLGITEAGSIRHFFIDKKSRITDSFVPVGYPVEDMEIILLDDQGQAVAPGQTGEIVVKSRYLSPGYWQKPALTEARFLPDPEGTDKRLYLTGDLGRLLPDGCLVHLGRKDFQVKVRGQRVEIAEIEAALLALGLVREAVVVAREDGAEGQSLVAYLVPAHQPPPTVTTLRNLLAESLPPYMIPSAFVMLAALPLMATGKVDRQALPEPGLTRPSLDIAFVAPRTALEERLAEVWRNVLGLDRVGVNDNFLDLGGHSLLATQIVSRLRQSFEVELSLPDFFAAPTIAGLAQTLQRLRDNGLKTQPSKITPVSRAAYRLK